MVTGRPSSSPPNKPPIAFSCSFIIWRSYIEWTFAGREHVANWATGFCDDPKLLTSSYSTFLFNNIIFYQKMIIFHIENKKEIFKFSMFGLTRLFPIATCFIPGVNPIPLAPACARLLVSYILMMVILAKIWLFNKLCRGLPCEC